MNEWETSVKHLGFPAPRSTIAAFSAEAAPNTAGLGNVINLDAFNQEVERVKVETPQQTQWGNSFVAWNNVLHKD